MFKYCLRHINQIQTYYTDISPVIVDCISYNEVAQTLRNITVLNHRNLITLVNEQTDKVYYINVNAISNIAIDTNIITIYFSDDTDLFFYYANSEHTQFYFKYINDVLTGLDLYGHRNGRNVYYVNSAFQNSGYHYSTINDAISAASAGDYIIITAGTYAAFAISKNLEFEFKENAVVTSSSGTAAVTISNNVHAKIFGYGKFNNTSSGYGFAIGTDVNLYCEFEEVNTVSGNILQAISGNYIFKGKKFYTSAAQNLFVFSPNMSLFDVLYYESENAENLHNNGLTIAENHLEVYVNSKFNGETTNYNIEHAQHIESETAKFFNCVFHTPESEGNITTFAGGTDEPVNLYMADCFFQADNSDYNIVTTISITPCELNMNFVNDCYGNKGTTDASDGLYITTRNGKNFITDSNINVINLA